MKVLRGVLRGEGLRERALRSSAWTIFGYGASQAIRLGSNLILTRLLFPEAFGLMALVTVFMVGLHMFSDIGIGPSILQHKRGDERAFLNTAWSIQIARGICLWILACAIAWPVAGLYDAPILAELLPVAGLSLILGGFNPTALETANRHLALGRVMQADLLSQVVGILLMILIALATGSVWSLAVGGVATALAKLCFARWLLPGGSDDRMGWEPGAAREIIHFGKWVFLSTAFSFLVAQGDRLILGIYLSLELLGLYNIGYFLASFPIYLGSALMWRILIPLYREKPPAASKENFAKIRLMRMGLTGFLLALLLALAFSGVPLVGLIYDSRYATSGAIVVLAAVVQIPLLIGMTYDQVPIAAGDSRRYAFMIGVRAVLVMVCMVSGAEIAGVAGALVGQGLALLAVYPMVIWIARLHGAWDPLHDGLYAGLGLGLGGFALWLSRDALAALGA